MQELLIEARGPALWLTINRPALRNAFNEQVVGLIATGIRQAQSSPEIRAIVLTGAGDRAFCAGGDLSATATDAPFTVDPAHPRNFVIALFKLMEDCELPIIARVNGHALAGGLGLMCACDLVIAADHATFGVPEARVGLFPMMIMPYLLRIIPLRRLMHMCMTGHPVAAAEALSLGLINEAVPTAELDSRVHHLIDAIVHASPTAQRLGKHGLHAMRDMTIRQAWEFAELMLPMMASTQDAREGFAAFREKRAPIWTGQ